jgi:demethylmenaquinone methyltransferase/2-methoxy-6-polyprenyl-1,4-benzoquinol methylase
MSGTAAAPPAGPGAPSERNRFARVLFSDLPSGYDRLAEALSFGQNGRWRRFMVSRVRVDSDARVLDVATGTAAIAAGVAGRTGASVVGLDQSEEMLRTGVGARRGPGGGGWGRGQRLPFPDETFDAVTFTYLLRYVDDPAATLAELTRVLRPGGTLANLEFLLPPRRAWRLVWSAYTRFALPVLGRAASPAWGEVGRFLGPSIRDFYGRLPLSQQLSLWRAAGVGDVRARPMSFGSGVVVWGRKSRT